MSLFDDGRTRALKAQLKALNAPRYRVTLRTPDDRVQVAVLSAADLLGQERWLCGQNEVGAQVRLRPADPSGLVLVGPLSGRQRIAMEEDGFPGALVTTLGADRYEVWVRLAATQGLHALSAPPGAPAPPAPWGPASPAPCALPPDAASSPPAPARSARAVPSAPA